MRATEYLFFVIIIGVFAWISVSGIIELNQGFGSGEDINISGIENQYNNIENISRRANTSIENFKSLGDTEKSWFQKIGAGIVAIPYAVISFPIMIIEAIVSLQNMITITFGEMIPPIILLALLTFIIVETIRRFLEFFQRSRA